MAGFLTRKDELDFVRTEDERLKSKKYYTKNRTRVIERIKNNQEKKKQILEPKEIII